MFCNHRWFCWLRAAAYAAGWVGILALGLAFRLPGLDRRPMHPDEANQAWKTGLLWQSGQYRYDPSEHHGPTLYYLSLPVLWMVGAGDFAQSTEGQYRLLPALAGVGLVLAAVLLWKSLGAGAVCWAAALTALSPVMVFYSRYYIQEMLLVLFTLGVLGSLAGWRRAKSLAGAACWAGLSGVCLGLMAATKETWVLALAAMAAAGLLERFWNRWFPHTQPPALPAEAHPREQNAIPGFPLGKSWAKWTLPAGIAVLAALGVIWAFYTSFGVQPEGLQDVWGAYRVYLRRGMEAGIHRHGVLFYFHRLLAYRAKGLWWSEGLILLLACLGVLGAFWPRKEADCLPVEEGRSAHRGFARFLVFYTVVLTVFYSAIPYKTPWCAVQFWHGWILLGGLGCRGLMGWTTRLASRPVSVLATAGAGLLLLVGLGHLAWESWQLNFNPRLFADGEKNPWVYAHTATDILRLAERMEQFAALAPEGHRIGIHVIVSDNYWPLPWYLRRFDQERIGYWDRAEGWVEVCDRWPPPHVLIVQADLADQIDPHLQAPYNQQMLYRLRPEVFLRVYVRQDLWENFLKSVSSGGTASFNQTPNR